MLLLFVVIIRFKHTTTWPSVEVDHDCMGALYALLSFILKMPARPWGSTPLLWSLSIARLLQLYSAGGASGEINERRVKFQFLLFWFQCLTSDYFQVTSAFSMPVVLPYVLRWEHTPVLSCLWTALPRPETPLLWRCPPTLRPHALGPVQCSDAAPC